MTETEAQMDLRRDCIHYRGDVPCTPHKERGLHCADCPEYLRREGRILLIKLGAAGDVVRTTPLLHPLGRDYPRHRLTWLTEFPDLVPMSVPDRRRFDATSVLWARNTAFDLVINLDKDPEACALATEVLADRKFGFVLGDDGFCSAVGEAAEAKILTGVFDDVNQRNSLSYPAEIFGICGYEFAGEEYVLDRPALPASVAPASGRAVVGLNTGCGGRWTSRLWPEDHWAALVGLLRKEGLGVMLLGGPEEDGRNRRLSEATGALYHGTFPLGEFVGVMDLCDVVVTAVTMAMHLAIGLGKELVLFNNIFNPAEFELYGRGEIVTPETSCSCFFAPRCREAKPCMDTLRPEAVRDAVLRRVDAR